MSDNDQRACFIIFWKKILTFIPSSGTKKSFVEFKDYKLKSRWSGGAFAETSEPRLRPLEKAPGPQKRPIFSPCIVCHATKLPHNPHMCVVVRFQILPFCLSCAPPGQVGRQTSKLMKKEKNDVNITSTSKSTSPAWVIFLSVIFAKLSPKS